MAKKTIVNAISDVVPSGASTLTLTMKALSTNVLVCYDRITAVDHTSGCSTMTFGFKVGSDEVLLESFSTVSAGEVKAVLGKVFAPGHYRPFVRVTGANAGDRISLFTYGYITDLPE